MLMSRTRIASLGLLACASWVAASGCLGTLQGLSWRLRRLRCPLEPGHELPVPVRDIQSGLERGHRRRRAIPRWVHQLDRPSGAASSYAAHHLRPSSSQSSSMTSSNTCSGARSVRSPSLSASAWLPVPKSTTAARAGMSITFATPPWVDCACYKKARLLVRSSMPPRLSPSLVGVPGSPLRQ